MQFDSVTFKSYFKTGFGNEINGLETKFPPAESNFETLPWKIHMSTKKKELYIVQHEC